MGEDDSVEYPVSINTAECEKDSTVSRIDVLANKMSEMASKAQAFDIIIGCLVDMGFYIEGTEQEVVAALCCDVMKSNAEAVFKYVRSRKNTEQAQAIADALAAQVGGSQQDVAELMSVLVGIQVPILCAEISAKEGEQHDDDTNAS